MENEYEELLAEEDRASYYNLEKRTFEFARDIRLFISKIKPTIGNVEDGKQVVRSSGSVGANYIEANESLSKKDFLYRIKICKKEAKESNYWLKLIEATNHDLNQKDISILIQESIELTKIFASIASKIKL